MTILPQPVPFFSKGKSEGPISLSVPKDLGFMPVVRLAVAGVALRARLPLQTIEDLKVIASEACTYCLTRGRNQGRLRIVLEVRTDRFIVEVADPHFELVPARTGSAVQPEDGADELFIIRNLADELEYRTLPGNGLLLRMTKTTS